MSETIYVVVWKPNGHIHKAFRDKDKADALADKIENKRRKIAKIIDRLFAGTKRQTLVKKCELL